MLSEGSILLLAPLVKKKKIIKSAKKLLKKVEAVTKPLSGVSKPQVTKPVTKPITKPITKPKLGKLVKKGKLLDF